MSLKRSSQSSIAIIPARSGSKGLKDKNIKLLCGKPLMAYTIEAALHSGVFDVVHVSTDSSNYAEIAEAYGADVPFLRSTSLSEDGSSTWDAAREVLERYAQMGERFDYCVILQPTSPLRDAYDIKAAQRAFEDVDASSLTSVVAVEHPVQWCFPLDESLSMASFSKSCYRNSRRQELQPHYRENGAIFATQAERILDEQFDFYAGHCLAYIMDRQSSIDIDSEEDFLLAEWILGRRTGDLRE